jgi:NTP pyrophosphatase (non-canonical NTP hydrolase)
MGKRQSSGVLPMLSQQAVEDSHRWFPTQDPLGLPFYTLALAGEVGELANIIKKVERGSLDWQDAKVRFAANMETTDVFIYLLIIAGLMQIDLEAAYNVKRQLNEQRFGPGGSEVNGSGPRGGSAGAEPPVRLIVPGETPPG